MIAATFGRAVARAVGGFGYWLGVFFCLYGATAGDRRADAPPPTAFEVYATPVAIVVAAVLLHAAVSTAWRSRR